jgi:hypothetical protein
MNGLQTILDKQKDTPIEEEEIRIRKLLSVTPRTDVGMVKTENAPFEFDRDYMVFFKPNSTPKQYQEAIDNGKDVWVTLKMVGMHWSIVKTPEIRKPPVEIPEPTLEEQRAEIEGLGNDY